MRRVDQGGFRPDNRTVANDFDVIVVGSGYGGMLPAWRLSRAGARVLVIERGRRMEPADFEQSWSPDYIGRIYDVGFSTSLTETYRASRALGGGSVMNSMMHQRVPSEGFAFVDPDTSRMAWPYGVDRASLDPHYAAVEELLGVRQLSWDEVSRNGGNFARLFRDAGLTCDRGRMNIGPGCVRCGFCEAGCTFRDGKITLAGRALSEARATGNLTIRESLTVARVAEESGSYRVDCVRTGSPVKGRLVDAVYRAPKVVLAAGPLGTVPLLWRSRPGLRRLSRALGRWVSNNGDVNFLFLMPPHYPDQYGHRSTNNAGTISYAFWGEHRATMHPGFSPVGVMAGIDVRFEGGLPWGLEHKHFVKANAIHRLIPVNAMRQIPSQMKIGIDGNGGARIEVPLTRDLREHGPYMVRLAKRVAEPAGGRVLVTGIGNRLLDMGGNHILGGARMSDEPDTGVVALNGEVFGHPGLYVTDAAAIPSTLGINPALTIGANALRIADGIARGTA